MYCSIKHNVRATESNLGVVICWCFLQAHISLALIFVGFACRKYDVSPVLPPTADIVTHKLHTYIFLCHCNAIYGMFVCLIYKNIIFYVKIVCINAVFLKWKNLQVFIFIWIYEKVFLTLHCAQCVLWVCVFNKFVALRDKVLFLSSEKIICTCEFLCPKR